MPGVPGLIPGESVFDDWLEVVGGRLEFGGVPGLIPAGVATVELGEFAGTATLEELAEFVGVLPVVLPVVLPDVRAPLPVVVPLAPLVEPLPVEAPPVEPLVVAAPPPAPPAPLLACAYAKPHPNNERAATSVTWEDLLIIHLMSSARMRARRHGCAHHMRMNQAGI